jgi:predicted hydrocarbon binding protein
MRGPYLKLPKESFSFQFVTFNDMVSALELIFSPSAASVILFTAAVRCGTQLYNRMRKEIRTKEEALRVLSELKKEENWGKLVFRDVDFANGSGKIIVEDSFETVARKAEKARGTTRPCCNFLRGFLSGFLSELFEKSITVTEEKCVGKGDERCEFVFR